MTQIIPFESNTLPAYLRAGTPVTNEDLVAHAGTGFPIISIKGKVFTVSREGEKVVLPNPKDPDSPASNIDVVLIKANKATSKVWYAGGYVDGSDAKPDCFSNDGKVPDPSSTRQQAKACAACPKNAWGSKINEHGVAGKGKACSDSVRIAVSKPDLINDPYFIRVPAASIRNLGEYGKLLAKRGVSYQMVVTKIGFDPASPTPTLTFKPVGFLDEQSYMQVKEEAAGDVVQAILATNIVETEVPAAAAPAEDVELATKVIEKVAAKPAVKPTAKVEVEEVAAVVEAAVAQPAPAPAAKPATVDIGEIDLDDLSFDD